jgi:hypothetical protein
VAFEKRVAIKSWLSQKLRKAKVYSDKLTNQNVLFFRLHKKQDVTCSPTRVPGAYERRLAVLSHEVRQWGRLHGKDVANATPPGGPRGARRKVKWDDGGPAVKSALAHLQHNPGPDESDFDDEEEEKKEETALGALTSLEQEDDDSDADVPEPEEDDREGSAPDTDSEGGDDQPADNECIAIGEETVAGDLTWKRVANVGPDRRGDKPKSRGRVKC